MEKDEIALGRAENLKDKQFGYLQPLYRTYNIGKHTAWKCRCLRDDNLISVRVDHLKEGRVIFKLKPSLSSSYTQQVFSLVP